MKQLRLAFSLLIVLAAIATVFAQTGKPGGGSTATTATTGATGTTTPGTTATTGTGNVQEVLQEILEGPGTGSETYRYDPQGRRDPFQSLIGPAPKLQAGAR